MASLGGTRRRPKPGRAAGRVRKRGAPRAQEPAERRAAILDAALAEFAARGFADTRLDDVARHAGIAKGTIYLYFRDKENLFQELVRAKLSPLVGAIASARDARPPHPRARRAHRRYFRQRDLRHAAAGRDPAHHH